VAGKPAGKRGKLSGRKALYECPGCLARRISPAAATAPTCASCGDRPMTSLLTPLIRGGRLVRELPPVHDLRARVLERLARVEP
jgi:nicotinate phosphoribosyltransferase